MSSEPVRYTPQEIGQLIRECRKQLGVTQKDLALTSGTGLRFVIDLEKGKEPGLHAGDPLHGFSA